MYPNLISLRFAGVINIYFVMDLLELPSNPESPPNLNLCDSNHNQFVQIFLPFPRFLDQKKMLG